MTTPTTTIKLTQGIGYRGKMGERAYIAEITGSDARYDLARTFLDADQVERDHFNRARYTRTYTYLLPAGLYEISEHGERRFLIVWQTPDGAKRINIDAARVQAIARLLDTGMSYNEARRATRPVTTPASAAQ